MNRHSLHELHARSVVLHRHALRDVAVGRAVALSYRNQRQRT